MSEWVDVNETSFVLTTPTPNFRWLARLDGSTVLQQQHSCQMHSNNGPPGLRYTEWKNVPVVHETPAGDDTGGVK